MAAWSRDINGLVCYRQAPCGDSVRLDYIGCCHNDLPQRAVGALVIDAAAVVRPLFLEHAEAHEATSFAGYGALLDDFAGWLGLVEAWLVTANDPQRQHQSAGTSEELASNFVCVQRRAPNPDYYSLSRI